MRRFLVLLMLLAPPTGAIAQREGRSNPNPLPLQGAATFDVRRYGAKGDGAANDTPAIQAAHDAAATYVTSAGLNGIKKPRAYVYLPATVKGYSTNAPIYNDASWVGFLGDGTGSQVNVQPQTGCPAFVIGLPRLGTGVGSSYRPSLFGKLDAIAAPSSTSRYGFRTNANAFIFSQGSTLTHGGISPTLGSAVPTTDVWRETQALTIEACLEGFNSGVLPSGIFTGLGKTYGQSTYPRSPYAITTTGSGGFAFRLSYQTAQFAVPVQLDYTFTSPAPTGVQRVTIQVDMVAGKVNAWVGGNGAQPVQVAVTGPAIPAGVSLNQNIFDAFLINQSVGSNTLPFGQASLPDFAVYGFALHRTLLYPDLGTGSAQVMHPQIGGTSSGGPLYLPGSPTGGTYTLSYGGQTTGAISATATAATVQTALQALSTIGANNLTVTGNAGGPYTLATANGFTLKPSGTYACGITCDGTNLTGQVITDAIRYFAAENQAQNATEPNVLAYLAFNEPVTSRHLFINGSHAQSGGFLSSAFIGGVDQYGAGQFTPNQLGNGFYRMGVNAAGMGGGFLVMGGVNDFAMEDVNCDAASLYGFMVAMHGANYTHHFRRCRFSATDVPMQFHWSTAKLDNIDFLLPGRSCVKAIGSVVDMNGFNVENWLPQVESVAQFYSDGYGGSSTLVGGVIDYEGLSFRRSGVLFQRHAYQETKLSLDHMRFQSLGNVPIIELDDVGPSGSALQSANLTINDTLSLGGLALIKSNGPCWRGNVQAVANCPVHLIQTGTYGRSTIMVTDGNRRLPWRTGTWYAGSSEFLVPAPANGQPKSYRCAQDGQYGTANPPGWSASGAARMDATASLSGAAVGHTAITTTVSGQVSAWGQPTTLLASQLGSTLFNGAALNPPTTLYVGLATTYYGRTGVNAEPAAPTGYTRVAVAANTTNFPLASAGSKSNGTAITFPTATAAYTVNAVFIGNSSNGGNNTILYVMPLAAPLNVAIGQTPTIAIGGIVLTNVPMPGMLGTMTDYGWGKCHDAILSGAALGNPSSWYVALSSTKLTRSAPTPTEPGNGYARVAVAADATHWLASSPIDQQEGDALNLLPIAFPTPSGTQGTLTDEALMDAGSGGNPWFIGPLTAPVTPGTAAPTFAIGALMPAVS